VRNSFDSALVNAALITLPGAWREVEFHPSLGSTNEAIRSLPGATAACDEPYDGQHLPDDEGLWRVVLTDHQTGGRGRLGRGWQVPDRAAISMSVTVPVAGPEELPWVPLLAGVALSRAILTTTTTAASPLTPRLKWPNDVLIGEAADRKVSGILCEYVPAGRTPTVVIGTGINVEQTEAELPVPTATSLALAGARVPREDLVVAYLAELGRLFAPGARDEREVGTAAYRSLCATLGQHVRIHLPGGATVDGEATGIGEGAELLVSTAEGERAFAAGDVVHVRRPGGGLA
jgi:BirA family biotin operon repressor/biotin-[acetyl-CoA-carboxylase] ligase